MEKELGGLPEGWVVANLGEYIYLKNGFAFKSNDYVNPSENTYPVIRISDLDGNVATSRNSVHVLDAPNGYGITNGDLLIAMSGATTGKLGVYKDNVYALQNQRVGKLIFCAEKYGNIAYRNYLLAYISGEILKIAYGGAQPNISGKAIESLKIPFSPYEEQLVIAERLGSLLSNVDNIKTRLDKIPQILKRFRQAVLSAAVSGKLTEEWRLENEVSFNEWQILNVGLVAQVATGKTPKRTESKYWNNGVIPWLTSGCTGQVFVKEADQYITPLAVKECTLKLFDPGTLLLAMYGEGKTRGQVTELKLRATCNQACAAIIVNNEIIERNFMKIRLMENYEETRKAAVGGAQPNLNLNKVREIPIMVPPLEEQTEIVARVEKLFAWADNIEKQVNAAQQRVNNLTQSILAKAFRGELTEQWRKDHPELISGENSAAALLEKIKIERAAQTKKSKKKA